jgi:Na+-transporting methylmalonyl-CoA/oxaloacetate decarboxylase gamma subunit
MIRKWITALPVALLYLLFAGATAVQAKKPAGWKGIQEGEGVTLMIVGIIVVFVALLMLLVLMVLLKRAQDAWHKRQMARQKKAQAEAAGEEVSDLGIHVEGHEDVPGVVIAAIAMTIILEEETIHDQESLVLTLHAIPRPYSNWWQTQLSEPWGPRTTGGRPQVLQKPDPEKVREGNLV